MRRYRLRLMFDAGSGHCLWADDDATRDRFGIPPDLPLPADLQAEADALCEAYDASFPWDDPGGAEPAWDDLEEAAFQARVEAFVHRLRRALGENFDIVL